MTKTKIQALKSLVQSLGSCQQILRSNFLSLSKFLGVALSSFSTFCYIRISQMGYIPPALGSPDILVKNVDSLDSANNLGGMCVYGGTWQCVYRVYYGWRRLGL